EADKQRAVSLLAGLDHLVVQDLFLTRTAELADVVLPGCAGWAESEGTVTSSERRVQRVRKAIEPPGEARDDVEIVYELARRLGHELGCTRAGGSRSSRTARRSRRSSTRRRSTCSTRSSRCGSRRAAGSSRSTPACSRGSSRRPCTSAARRYVSRPRTARSTGSSTAAARAFLLAAARSKHRSR